MQLLVTNGCLLQNEYNYGQFYVFNMIYRLMLGDYTNFDNFNDDYIPIPLWIGMILFTILLSIIMLNLLISIIGTTYNKVVDSEKSMRNIELLGVIAEIDKYHIKGTKNHNKQVHSLIHLPM